MKQTRVPVLFLLACVLTCLVMAHMEIPVPNVYEVSSRQCVFVRTHDDWGGSGFCVRRTDAEGSLHWFVFTAAHVVSEDFSPTVEVHKGKLCVPFPARVVEYSADVDTAILEVPETYLPRLGATFRRDSSARLGDKISVCGSPRGSGFFNTFSFGYISRVNVEAVWPGWRWKDTDQMDVSIYPGNSGGPVYDAEGKVLGIVVGGVVPSECAFIPVRAIEAWLRRIGALWAIDPSLPCPSFRPFDVPGIDVDPDPVSSHCL